MERDYSIEKLKYQENKFAYNIALIAFLLNQVYLVYSLNNMTKDWNVGIEVFINLGMYMFLFLGMERVKNHDKSWSVGFIVLGSSFFFRILYIPRMILEKSKELALVGDANSLQISDKLEEAATIAAVAVFLAGVLIIISGIHGYKQSVTIKNYNESMELN